MHISWLGLSACKFETSDATVLTDPFAPSVFSPPLRAKADVVTMSNRESEAHNHRAGVLGNPFVIDIPGEFEVKGVYLQGISLSLEPMTTAFTFDMDGLRLVHFGDTPSPPAQALLERLGEVDVLCLPVGGGTTLAPEAAVKVVNEIEPRVVVPIFFQTEGVKLRTKLLPVTMFLREMGASRVEPVERVSLKKRDLVGEETKVVVLRS
jgi:L-ascorbate metabolism protein UlaG (beta-lactamase superfamily)